MTTGSIRGVGPETGGVMLIIAGLAFALERFTALDGVWRWLPLFVIYLAARDFWHPPTAATRTIVPLLVGVWLFLTTIGFLELNFLNSWPLLIVFVGLGLVIDGLMEGTRTERQIAGKD
jgi:hypothetical protein